MQTFNETNKPELQILTIKTTFFGQTMFIAVVYKAPKLRDLTFQDQLMTSLIETGNHSSANHIVCGDFKKDFNKKSAITTELIEAFCNLGFILISTSNETTGNTTVTKTVIDICFADFNCKSNVVKTTITDHCSIIVQTVENLKNDTNSNREKYEGRNWSKLKQHKMQSLLNCNLTIKLIVENQTLKQCSTQEAFRKIEEILTDALDEVIPSKQLSNKPIRRCWINNELKNCCLKKLKCTSVSQIKHRKRQKYLYTTKNIKKTLIRKTKCNFLKTFSAKITIPKRDSSTNL